MIQNVGRKLKLIRNNLILISILFLALYLRIWNLPQFPIVHRDETWHGEVAIDILKFGIVRHFISVPFLIVPWNGPMFEYVLIPSLYLLGVNIFALRLPSVIVGTLTVFLIYLFVKEFYNEKVALLTSFLLAIYPTHIYLSRVALEHGLILFFITMCLYFYHLYKKTKENRYLYLFSLSAGFGVITKLSFIFFLIAFIPSSLFLYNIQKIKRSFFQKNMIKKYIFAFLLFFLVVYPLIRYYTRGDFRELRELQKNFPITPHGADLRDVKTNFILCLGNFYKLLIGDISHILVPSAFHFQSFAAISILLLIFLFFIDITYLRKVSPSLFKKDLFLFLNFFCSIVLVSTVTISQFYNIGFFHNIEFTITISFLVTIIGRSVYELFKKVFNFVLLLLIFSFIIGLFVFHVYPFLDFREEVPNPCSPYYFEKVAKKITEFNTSNVFVGLHSLEESLRWYVYKENLDLKIDNLEGYPREQLATLFSEKNNLYIFDNAFCGCPRSRIHYAINLTNNQRELLLNISSQLNRTVIKTVIKYEGESQPGWPKGRNLYTFYYVE